MILEITKKHNLLLILELALFNFIFLGIEYMFDGMMAFHTDSSGVVMAQNEVLGASVIGFILYAFIDKFALDEKGRRIISIVLAVLSAIFVFVICLHKNFVSIMISGVLVFIILGIAGSAVCYTTARIITDRRYLARLVGIAYAFGILIQFVNNNLVSSQGVQTVFIIVSIAVFVAVLWLLGNPDKDIIEEDKARKPRHNRVILSVISLVICVALMTIIFSTLDAAVTLVHASGDFNIGQWPRLLLAVSGITAGFLYDLFERKFMPVIMYIVTILATICVVVIQFGGPFIIGLLIFYMSAGFFVVFFMTSFMDMSFYMNYPKLWAGMGRATNNLCALATSAISVALLGSGSQMAIMITALVLFALINVALIFYTQPLRIAELNQIKETAVVEAKENIKTQSEKDKFEAFVLRYSLTEREEDVLKALLESDDNVQEIAHSLGLSCSVLYRHFAYINKKTDTNSRLGIIQFYHGWKADEE